MNNSLLGDLKDFSKTKLKKVSTQILYLNGRTFVKNEGELIETETNASSSG